MKTKLNPTAPTAPPVAASGGSIPVQAAAILILGGIAAAVFRADGDPAAAVPPQGGEALVRRTSPPPLAAANSTTQLLGYVETSTSGTEARPAPRTAAQINRTASWSEVTMTVPSDTAPPPLPPKFVDVGPAPETQTSTRFSAPMQVAAVGSGSLATMRPYEAYQSSDAAGLSSTPANVVRRHQVRDGDTLGDLAQRYYGDAGRYREIYDANRATLTDPQLLPIGSTLIIPAYDPRVVAPPSDPPSARLVPQVILGQ